MTKTSEQPIKLTVDERLMNRAEATVLRYRGSYDAPGFDACVESEYKALKAQQRPKTSALPKPTQGE